MNSTASIEAITNRVSVRRIKTSGVERLKEKINKLGFQPQHPLLVAQNEDGTYELIDGNHRLEAAKALGIDTLPIHVITEPLTDNDKKRLARQANESTEMVIPTTFVDDAELVWSEVEAGKTQVEIQGVLGWGSVDKVNKYYALNRIDKRAWKIITTTFEEVVGSDEEEAVGSKPTTVVFTEGLLRSVIDLTPDQQLELVQALAKGDIQKGKFKAQAENYKSRNDMKTYALAHLGELGETFTNQLLKEIYSGAYDADWKNPEHPKLYKLIQSLRDEWERKNSIHLVHGDFYEEVKKIGDGSIDLVLTDPPYNIANERVFTLEGRSNISQNFGEWDKYSHEDFIALFDMWAAEWARILRDGGSGYVFTSDLYLHHLREALKKAGLDVHIPIIWHKPNPAPQMITTTFQSTVEYILFFVKGKDYTFHWQGHAGEMHNHIEAPVCGGKERLTDAKGNTFHPTQKPEQVIRHFMEISSNRGDTVFDGFMGVGSTGVAAKRLGRKFIGIEQDKAFYDTATRRLTE